MDFNLFKVVKVARAKATLAVMSKGLTFHKVVGEKIPDELTSFLGTTDKWAKVNFPEDIGVTSCIYLGKRGSIFKPHKHKLNSEHVTILNETGKLKIITPEALEELHYPNSIVFPANTTHAVVFLEDTQILVMWHPKMKHGWSADYIAGDEF